MKDGSMAVLMINGMAVEYYRYGPLPSAAPTLVFLHEGLGSALMWRDFPRQLADRLGCGAFVYSRFGYGNSDPCALPRPLEYMREEGLKVLPMIVAAAGLEEYILVGHSDGGSIALIYGGGVKSKGLLGVVTLAAHVFCEQLSVCSIASVCEDYRTGKLREKLQREHGENVDCAFWGWNRAWLDPAFMDWNIEEYLPALNVPLLAIQGSEDQYGTVAQLHSIGKQAGGPVETLLLPGCRHNPHCDQTEKTLTACTRFCSQIIPG